MTLELIGVACFYLLAAIVIVVTLPSGRAKR